MRVLWLSWYAVLAVVGAFAQPAGMTAQEEAEARQVLGSISTLPSRAATNVFPSAVESSPELRRFLRDEERLLEIRRLEAEMRRVVAERAAIAAKREVVTPEPPVVPPVNGPDTANEATANEQRAPAIEASPSTTPPVKQTRTRDELFEELRKKRETMSPEEYQRKRFQILMEVPR